eukprot:jgi/Undpi1/3159/HiC_scaffold_15.g06533.m1
MFSLATAVMMGVQGSSGDPSTLAPAASPVAGTAKDSASLFGVRLKVRRLAAPLSPGCSVIAPSLRTPLAGGSDIEENIRDPFTEVGVTAKCLLRLQLLSGGWVRIFPVARTPLSSTAAAATAAAARTLTPPSVDSTTTNDNNNSPHGRLQESHSSAYSSTRQHNSIFSEGLLCRAVAVSSGLTTSLASDLPTTVGGDSELGQPPPLASDEVFLPPSVAFNAGLGPFSEYVVVKRAENGGGGGGGGGALGLLGGGAAVLHRSPPIARTASVSRVKRPRSAAAAGGGSGAGGGGAWSGPVSTAKRARAHALALTSFFSTPRVLRFGDVFGVSIPRPGGGRSTGGGGGDGGGSGDDGGVGCWWQELPEDDSADSEANEDEAIDTASGFATTAATPTATTAATISTPAVAAEPWTGNIRAEVGVSTNVINAINVINVSLSVGVGGGIDRSERASRGGSTLPKIEWR